VGISWGIAPVTGTLREALAEADRAMYDNKRARSLLPGDSRNAGAH
jgi:hypothetical protein